MNTTIKTIFTCENTRPLRFCRLTVFFATPTSYLLRCEINYELRKGRAGFRLDQAHSDVLLDSTYSACLLKTSHRAWSNRNLSCLCGIHTKSIVRFIRTTTKYETNEVRRVIHTACFTKTVRYSCILSYRKREGSPDGTVCRYVVERFSSPCFPNIQTVTATRIFCFFYDPYVCVALSLEPPANPDDQL